MFSPPDIPFRGASHGGDIPGRDGSGERLAMAMSKQQFPFGLGDSPQDLAFLCFDRPSCRLGGEPIDEVECVPAAQRQEFFAVIPGSNLLRQGLRRLEHGRVDGVLAHAPKPILGVTEIAFAAMHDSVPVATAGGLDLLADRVRSVEVVGQQPCSGQAKLGHLAISNRLLAKSLFKGGGLQLPPQAVLGRARVERPAAVVAEDFHPARPKSRGIEGCHGGSLCRQKGE